MDNIVPNPKICMSPNFFLESLGPTLESSLIFFSIFQKAIGVCEKLVKNCEWYIFCLYGSKLWWGPSSRTLDKIIVKYWILNIQRHIFEFSFPHGPIFFPLWPLVQTDFGTSVNINHREASNFHDFWRYSPWFLSK